MKQDVLTSFWTDPDEVLVWEAEFQQSGTYEAVIVHTLPQGEEEKRLTECVCELILGERTNPVDMKNVKGQLRLSKTGAHNIRIVRDGGQFIVPSAGKYHIHLRFRNITGPNCIHISHVNFKRLSL